MMRGVFLVICLLFATSGHSQTSEVFDHELSLNVTISDTGARPLVGELVLVTIEGVYRRHITLEKLLPITLDGFSWSQLGEDSWFERTENGKKVKVFRRRMALFPDRSGKLEIPSFTHRLTLLDEANKWFEHDISSPAIAVEVMPKPDFDGWWLPVKRLEVSDQWSNSPDQLAEGEGVLRVIRVEATGVSPDFLPPMPELTSPSAMIFPHPERRLVELTPDGPVSIVFWRWTIRPQNPPSAILEPLEIDYFDTINRVARKAIISPQRIAYAEVDLPDPPDRPAIGTDRSGVTAIAGICAAILGCLALLLGRQSMALSAILRRVGIDPNRRALHRAVKYNDVGAARSAAIAIAEEAGAGAGDHIARLDRDVFGKEPRAPDLREFRKRVLGR